MLPIDYKNKFMFENGYKMQCKICHKRISRNESSSHQGVNCICDPCRGLLSQMFRKTTYEIMNELQEAGRLMLEDFDCEEVDNG